MHGLCSPEKTLQVTLVACLPIWPVGWAPGRWGSHGGTPTDSDSTAGCGAGIGGWENLAVFLAICFGGPGGHTCASLCIFRSLITIHTTSILEGCHIHIW